jgi:hypothetical protein
LKAFIVCGHGALRQQKQRAGSIFNWRSFDTDGQCLPDLSMDYFPMQ